MFSGVASANSRFEFGSAPLRCCRTRSAAGSSGGDGGGGGGGGCK